MNRYTYLGKNGDMCCILTTLASPEILLENIDDITKEDFYFSEGGWNGCGSIVSVCQSLKAKQTGNIIKLRNPLVYYGEDFDMGHTYRWSFKVFELEYVETKRK